MRRSIGVLAVTSLAACSPASIAPASSDAGADASDATPIVDACKAFAHARCSRQQTCSPTSIELSYGNQSTCEQYFAITCMNRLRAPSTGATVAATQACTAATEDP